MPEDALDRTGDPPRRRGRPAGSGSSRTGASGRDAPKAGGDGSVRSLTRAFALLEDVAAHPEGATLGDLAQRAELAPSTAHRLLKTLEQHRFVTQDTERGLWFVGVQAFIVGAGFLRNRDFVATARPFMIRAMEESGESVNLAILDRAEGASGTPAQAGAAGTETGAIYLSQVESRQMMRALAPPGGRAPLNASGVGKALLAGLSPRDAERRIRMIPFQRFTEATLADADALMADIEAARNRGYAVDDEEHAVGLRCVAAPIFNEYAEPLAAVSISGPAARIPNDRLETLGRLIRDTAASISAELGGHTPMDFG